MRVQVFGKCQGAHRLGRVAIGQEVGELLQQVFVLLEQHGNLGMNSMHSQSYSRSAKKGGKVLETTIFTTYLLVDV